MKQGRCILESLFQKIFSFSIIPPSSWNYYLTQGPHRYDKHRRMTAMPLDNSELVSHDNI